jgi:hypothetical protein
MAVKLDMDLHVVGDVYGEGKKQRLLPEPGQR